jgi:hypothetical protein
VTIDEAVEDYRRALEALVQHAPAAAVVRPSVDARHTLRVEWRAIEGVSPARLARPEGSGTGAT